MVNPGMFVGRVDELQAVDRCLFQAKNGNPQHFLVLGERGIGKSSLLYYVELIASGKIKGFNQVGMRFLTVSIDLGNCPTQFDIIRKIARGLKQAAGEHLIAREAAKALWNWLTNWEVLGVKYQKTSTEMDSEEVMEDLVTRLSAFCSETVGHLDGVLFLIDEADRPHSDAGLGALLKFFTERLARKSCNNVIVGMAGLPSVMTRLRESHESSPRLFHTLPLEPLEVSERKQVVEIGLLNAAEKNHVATRATPEALSFIAELSEGYPHFVQQFAYDAFEQDHDDVIDVEDVGIGAYKEGGALSQLGDKYFAEMYHARIGSEDYRRVLNAMAPYGDGWVSRKDIICESGVSETNVTNALGTLKQKNIIIQDESRRGFYRLPTKSFGAWINAIKAAKQKTEGQSGELFLG